MKKTTIFTQLSIVIAIIVVINLIAESVYFRLDFTADKRYTLSKATKDILKNMDEVVTIKAYFTEELPPQLAYVKKDLRDLLVEYEDHSSGNVVFEFINPNESEELKQQAVQNGIMPVSINVVQNDQRQQLQAFMGLTFKSGNRTEVIPLLQPGAAMEYDLTTAIKKISIESKSKLAFITGYGEADIGTMRQLAEQLEVLYTPESFDLSQAVSVPVEYTTLVWVAPSDTITANKFEIIDDFLARGGSVMIAYSTLQGDLQNGFLSQAPDIGISAWLRDKGVVVGDQYVIDAQCASVNVRQQSGFFTINSQIEFPYFPLVSNFGSHPVSSGLDNILLPFVSQITTFGIDSAVRFTPLLFSSKVASLVNAPAYVDIQRRWSPRDFSTGDLVLAVAAENVQHGNGKLIVVPNASFIINGSGQQMQQLNPDNVNFASNAIDWLSDDTGLISLRTKGVSGRPLDPIDDTKKNLVKYGNVFAPVLLILIYGLVRRGARARKRQRWAEGNFN